MAYKTTTLEQIEAQAFRRQQIAFCLLTLFVIAVLLLLHALFSSLLGDPSTAVIVLLGAAFGAKVLETVWLESRQNGISRKTVQIETALSILGTFILVAALAFLTNRDDAPYFVLLAIPILQCAYHFGLVPTVVTITGSSAMIFAWLNHYFAQHPPVLMPEYLEAGMICVVFWIMGLLVWYLVGQLRMQQTRLYEKMGELAATRETLFAEEKLAAVGRLASGVAHEIRNPVAMISSSLATAAHPEADGREREEMFAIAEREARRLDHLTSDFLTYARPARPRRLAVEVADILRHIADVARMRASDRKIAVKWAADPGVEAEVDAQQLEGALLNLCLNAIDATPAEGRIELRAQPEGSMLWIEVENTGSRIDDDNLDRIFEPFFTTKAHGTGLGLAIAKGVAMAHGGDLILSSNEDGAVVFRMTLTKKREQDAGEE